MLLRGRIKSVILRRLFMTSSSVYGYGLRSSALPSLAFDFHRCHLDHSVFIWHTKSGIVVLTVYVDDILLIGSDSFGLLKTKE